MTCDEARGAFSDLYDEVLSGAPLVTLTQHLTSCPACRAEWAGFRKAMQAVADLGSAEPSPGFAARVRQRAEEPTRWQRLVWRLFLPLRVKVPIQAVALVLLAFAGLLLYQRSPELRRATESWEAPSPPVAGEAPAPASPPTSGRPARKDEGPAPGAEPPNVEQTEPQASPPAARLEAERAPRPSAPGDEASEPGKTAMPSESPTSEESSREPRAKSAEPGVAPQMPGGPAPAPGGPGGAVTPAPAVPITPAPPSSAPRARAAPPPPREPQTASRQAIPADVLYVTGLTDLADGKYERSLENFRAFLAQYPQDARVPEVRLRLGDAYFGQGRYAEALREYEAVARQFPSGPLVPTALYLQAQARLAQGDRSGCQLLRDVADLYPQAAEAALARQALSTRCR